jgi:hypothetical protein
MEVRRRCRDLSRVRGEGAAFCLCAHGSTLLARQLKGVAGWHGASSAQRVSENVRKKEHTRSVVEQREGGKFLP